MREVYKYIQLNCFWYPPCKTRALRRSRILVLAPDFSKLFARADSNDGRPADGHATENRLFVTKGLTDARLFLLFPGLDPLQQGRPSFSCSSTYCTTPTPTTSEMRTVVRDAVSQSAHEATVSALNQRSRVSLTAFRRDTSISRHDFKSAITGQPLHQ